MRQRASELLEAATGGTHDLSPLMGAGILTSAALVSALGRI